MSKNKYYILYTLAIIATILSCNKSNIDPNEYSASLNLVNAYPVTDDESALKMNFTGTNGVLATSRTLNYFYNGGLYENGTMVFGLPVGKTIPLLVYTSNDTIKPIFSEPITSDPKENYTLFIFGEPGNPTGLLSKDNLLIHSDSTTGVRFINLSPDAGDVSINLEGEQLGSEINSLSYKGMSEFKVYDANSTIDHLNFEIHDKNTGEIITSFWYDNIARFKNVTLIIRGLKNGDPGLSVIRVDN